ncbi:MAG: hypothetical protein ABSE93_19745 [Terriglobia bacterium]|jgi:hypothetical protein
MFPKRLVPLPVAAFVLFLNFSPAKLTAGQIPSPQALKNEVQLRALTQPGETKKASVGPAAQFIATSTQRIDRDRAEVRVYRNGQAVELFPKFHELLTATPADRQMGLERLVGKSITIVPSEKRADQWDIFTGVGGVDKLILAGNIFKVRQVLLSSRKNPLEVRVDGQMHRLKAGQALLVL